MIENVSPVNIGKIAFKANKDDKNVNKKPNIPEVADSVEISGKEKPKKKGVLGRILAIMGIVGGTIAGIIMIRKGKAQNTFKKTITEFEENIANKKIEFPKPEANNFSGVASKENPNIIYNTTLEGSHSITIKKDGATPESAKLLDKIFNFNKDNKVISITEYDDKFIDGKQLPSKIHEIIDRKVSKVHEYSYNEAGTVITEKVGNEVKTTDFSTKDVLKFTSKENDKIKKVSTTTNTKREILDYNAKTKVVIEQVDDSKYKVINSKAKADDMNEFEEVSTSTITINKDKCNVETKTVGKDEIEKKEQTLEEIENLLFQE